MDKKEAIEVLKMVRPFSKRGYVRDAFDTAIAAIEESMVQKPATNSNYAAAVNDLHALHSDVSLAGLPYGRSWLDRIEKIINHLNPAKPDCA